MSRYRFQLYTPDLKRQVCLLQKRMYRSFTWRHAAYLDWKYLRNPYLEEPLIYVALDDDRPVGIRGMFGSRWEAGAGSVVLPCAADTGVDPEYRNTGLFEALSDFVMEDVRSRGFSHVLNLSPTPDNYVVSIMTMGWKPLGSSKELVRDVTTPVSDRDSGSCPDAKHGTPVGLRLLGAKLPVRAKKALGFNQFILLDRNGRGRLDPVKVSRNPQPGLMEEIAGRSGNDGRLRHVRDREYFAWRFGNPHYCYRFLYWDEGSPEGYLVLQNRVADKRVNIVDWEGVNDRVKAGLLEAALRIGGFREVGTWSTALPESSLKILSENGFFRPAQAGNPGNGYRGHFMIKPMDVASKTDAVLGCDPLKEASWNLRMINSDGA